jgi:hypothetical protein
MVVLIIKYIKKWFNFRRLFRFQHSIKLLVFTTKIYSFFSKTLLAKDDKTHVLSILACLLRSIIRNNVIVTTITEENQWRQVAICDKWIIKYRTRQDNDVSFCCWHTDKNKDLVVNLHIVYRSSSNAVFHMFKLIEIARQKAIKKNRGRCQMFLGTIRK